MDANKICLFFDGNCSLRRWKKKTFKVALKRKRYHPIFEFKRIQIFIPVHSKCSYPCKSLFYVRISWNFLQELKILLFAPPLPQFNPHFRVLKAMPVTTPFSWNPLNFPIFRGGKDVRKWSPRKALWSIKEPFLVTTSIEIFAPLAFKKLPNLLSVSDLSFHLCWKPEKFPRESRSGLW